MTDSYLSILPLHDYTRALANGILSNTEFSRVLGLIHFPLFNYPSIFPNVKWTNVDKARKKKINPCKFFPLPLFCHVSLHGSPSSQHPLAAHRSLQCLAGGEQGYL